MAPESADCTAGPIAAAGGLRAAPVACAPGTPLRKSSPRRLPPGGLEAGRAAGLAERAGETPFRKSLPTRLADCAGRDGWVVAEGAADALGAGVAAVRAGTVCAGIGLAAAEGRV